MVGDILLRNYMKVVSVGTYLFVLTNT
jgi:hypothetical protein